MKLVTLILFVCIELCVFADNINGIHVKTYGTRTDQALIFVHGGPGYNSHDFEVTTAVNLAKLGYFVVTYDQRGQGRSLPTDLANYSYDQYADDIKDISENYNLKNIVLLGHSHGGAVSIHTLKKYPHLVKKVALLGAPLDWVALTDAIIANCKKNYSAVGNSEYLVGLEKVESSFKRYPLLDDNQKVGAVGWIFVHAGACELYNVSDPTEEFKNFQVLLKNTPIERVNASNSQKPMPSFIKNEDYIRQNLLDFVAKNNSKFCGIYGSEDGLFTPASLNSIRKAIEPNMSNSRFHILKGASHHFYFQRQKDFFSYLKSRCDI